VSKSDAESKLARILPINAKVSDMPSPAVTFGFFVRQAYLPFKKRKWKEDSTAPDSEHRINSHLVSIFEDRPLSTDCEDELQDLLERKANEGYSFSVVDHIKRDLAAIFRRAVDKGYLRLNPAKDLFTPRNTRRPVKRTMVADDLNPFFSVLDLRERVIGGLGIFAGR
jgi:hypothetical protein